MSSTDRKGSISRSAESLEKAAFGCISRRRPMGRQLSRQAFPERSTAAEHLGFGLVAVVNTTSGMRSS
jgi:hypothetical protein